MGVGRQRSGMLTVGAGRVRSLGRGWVRPGLPGFRSKAAWWSRGWAVSGRLGGALPAGKGGRGAGRYTSALQPRRAGCTAQPRRGARGDVLLPFWRRRGWGGGRRAVCIDALPWQGAMYGLPPAPPWCLGGSPRLVRVGLCGGGGGRGACRGGRRGLGSPNTPTAGLR